MFGTIRKHQKWLWLVIIGFTIVAFVIFFSPDVNMTERGRPEVNFGTIDGDPIKREEMQEAQKEVTLRFFLNYGQWPGNPEVDNMLQFDLVQETYSRLLLMKKLEELNIRTSAASAAQWTRELLQNSRVSYDQLMQALNREGKMKITSAEFDQFVRHELGIRQLIESIGAAGRLVTRQEAEELYRFENQRVDAKVALFSLTNYLDEVQVTPEALSEFYSNRMVNYRIPERVQARYVRFEITNYLDEAEQELAKRTNLNEIIDAAYQRRNTNDFPATATEAEVKAEIRERFRTEQARDLAHRKAAEFATAVYEKQPVQPENLNTLAAEKGLTVMVTSPMQEFRGPSEIDVPPRFTSLAFGLSGAMPFGEPVIADDAVYVLGFHKRYPAEFQPLDKIREEVTGDYRQAQALIRAQRRGTEFNTTMTNSLAQGKTFDQICAEAKVTPVDLPPFSIRTRSLPEAESLVSLQLLQQIAFATPPGKPSRFVPTGNGGVIVFVEKRLSADEEKMREEMDEYVTFLRQSRQTAVFQEWFRGLFQSGYIQIPQGIMERES